MENNVLKTGYRCLDEKYYGGIKKGELTLLYARPGMGASAFLSNVFINIISQISQTKCLFFTFDEPEKYIFEKMVCLKGRVSHWQYYSGEYYTKKDKDTASKTEKWLSEKLHAKTSQSRIVDKAHSLADLLLYVAEATASHGLDAIFIDNVYYLKEFANEDINHVVYILKETARRLNVAVFATAHILCRSKEFPATRRIKNKYILRTADKIMILDRPETLATAEELESGQVIKGAAEIHIIKNYTGECGFESLRYDGGTMRFFEPEHDYYEDEG